MIRPSIEFLTRLNIDAEQQDHQTKDEDRVHFYV
jgi:hypothetical protein